LIDGMVVTQPVLPMEGSLPPDLQGTLFRVGPGRSRDGRTRVLAETGGGSEASFEDEPQAASGPSGALHAVELRDGAAVSYLSRESDADAGVFWHAGSVLALTEVGLPLRYTRFLEPQQFGGSLTVPVASHTHRLASDGSRVLFSVEDRSAGSAEGTGNGDADDGDNGMDEGIWLLIGEWDAAGGFGTAQAVELERATWQHDIAVTDGHVVFIESPTARLSDPSNAAVPFGWVPGAEGWLGVAERGGDGDVQWFRYDPALVTHVLGAWEEDGGRGSDPDIILYVCTYEVPEPGQPVDGSASVVGPEGIGMTPIGGSLAVLERWRLSADRLERTQVDERHVEYPRMDAECEGGLFRYGYCIETGWSPAGSGARAGVAHRGLLRFDLQRDEVASWTPGPGRTPSEPLFVRAHDGHGDDEGWLLAVVDDPDRGASDLYILDASALGRRRPEAIIHLPERLPLRSHGEWVPADRYR
jgi:carotenoid cleavage dioxygenase-like enzyme